MKEKGDAYTKSITIDVAPNINPREYLPFDEDSKIVRVDSKNLTFDGIPTDELPIIDGATAAFPVYSAFVNAVYPETTKLYDGVFEYNNTVGGYNEKIVPFQRNEGSGSQSMFLRLMGDTPVMEPDTQTRIGGMGEIIEEVADYKSKSTSIGFSFRYYVEGMIQNPDIKMIAVNGVAPTKENIKNGTYAIIAPVYAVTYEGNPKESVPRLIDWILSEEGQYIINETGYVGIGDE